MVASYIVVLVVSSALSPEEAALEDDMAEARARLAQPKDSDAADPVERAEEHRDDAAAARHAAEQRELWKRAAEPKRVAFFGQPELHFARLRGENAPMPGLSFGLLIKGRLQIALQGFAQAAGVVPQADFRFTTGLAYAGPRIDWEIVSTRWFRFGAGALFAAGVYGVERDAGFEYGTLFVFEPALSVELRPLRWLGLGLDGGHRWLALPPRATLGVNDVNSWTGGFHVRFGL